MAHGFGGTDHRHLPIPAMTCRRLKYENTFLVVKDETSFRGRGRSHPPRLTRQYLDIEYARGHEAAMHYVSLLEASVSNSGTCSFEEVALHNDGSLMQDRDFSGRSHGYVREEGCKPPSHQCTGPSSVRDDV